MRLIPITSFKLGHVSIFIKDVPYRLSSCFVYTIAQFSRILRFSLIYCSLFNQCLSPLTLWNTRSKKQPWCQFLRVRDLRLWCLTPLSTIFQVRYVVAISFIGWENRSTTRKPPTWWLFLRSGIFLFIGIIS
jgi:hypothetical protein